MKVKRLTCYDDNHNVIDTRIYEYDDIDFTSDVVFQLINLHNDCTYVLVEYKYSFMTTSPTGKLFKGTFFAVSLDAAWARVKAILYSRFGTGQLNSMSHVTINDINIDIKSIL